MVAEGIEADGGITVVVAMHHCVHEQLSKRPFGVVR